MFIPSANSFQEMNLFESDRGERFPRPNHTASTDMGGGSELEEEELEEEEEVEEKGYEA